MIKIFNVFFVVFVLCQISRYLIFSGTFFFFFSSLFLCLFPFYSSLSFYCCLSYVCFLCDLSHTHSMFHISLINWQCSLFIIIFRMCSFRSIFLSVKQNVHNIIAIVTTMLLNGVATPSIFYLSLFNQRFHTTDPVYSMNSTYCKHHIL